jgi:hypothetical protein
MLRGIGKPRVGRPFRCAAIALVALALLAAPLPAFSQSCALCYTQASAAGARMIQALRSGILILIVPPTFMSLGMIFIVYRKRHQFRQADDVAVGDVPADDAPASDSTW